MKAPEQITKVGLQIQKLNCGGLQIRRNWYAFKNGKWDDSNTISAATNIISLVGSNKWINRLLGGKGGFYAAIINFYIYGTIWASKKGAEVESSLRNYFSPNSSNNYYQNIFGY